MVSFVYDHLISIMTGPYRSMTTNTTIIILLPTLLRDDLIINLTIKI